MDGFDAQIAAICTAHDATLATRNVNDFGHTGITVLDPWKAT
jgi:predicted nucleic acid-binding protein